MLIPVRKIKYDTANNAAKIWVMNGFLALSVVSVVKLTIKEQPKENNMKLNVTTICEPCNYCGTARTLGTHGQAEKHKNAVETVICNHKYGCKRTISNKKAAVPRWCPKVVNN